MKETVMQGKFYNTSKLVLVAVAALAVNTTMSAQEESFFPLTDVRLTGGPLKAQQEQSRKYLLRLDPDRLLSRFRSEAGLEPKAKPYGGWESAGRNDLAGHILGFYLSGSSMMYEATGDEELKRRLLYIAGELEAVQKAHGCGYALAFRDGRRFFSDLLRSNIVVRISQKTEYTSVINGRFEPIYTFNKVALGLYRAWVATGDEQVRRVFLNLSDWFGTDFLDKLSDADKDKILDCEHGSLPESFADAYRMTGDEKYRRWARRLCQNRMLVPLSEGNRRKEWMHKAAVNAMEAFMCDYAFANGGNAYDEHLFPTNAFEAKFQRLAGPESCGSINMLRLTEALFETDPSTRRMDFYERVLFDHILSTHDPFKGLTVYHTPTKWAASRTYSREFNAMWCCTGTGFEAPGKYAQAVFSHAVDDSAVRVNLFAPAALDWKARGVRLRQETAFPYGETTCLKIDAVGKEPKFTVKIRRPCWADERFAVYVNGAKEDGLSDGYVTITREWKAGDRIDVEFPMSLRAEALPGSKNYAAFFYGPTLLVGDLGTEGISRKDYIPPLSAGNGTPSFLWSNRFGAGIPMASIPADALRHPADYLEPTAVSPLTFRMKGTEILLVPMFALHYSRYAMYWRLMGDDECRDYAAACAKEGEYARRAVDSVVPGDRESEEAHRLDGKDHLDGENIYDKTYGWRGTHKGGFFTYRLAAGDGDKPLTLVARYRVCETGPRRFDVQVDGKTIFTEDLKNSGKRGFFYREMPIPQELTAGKKEIEVKFAAKPGNIAGGLFGLWLVR